MTRTTRRSLAAKSVICDRRCHTKFLGVIGQGYECRGCRAVLHKRCLADLPCAERLGPADPDILMESPMRRTGSIALPVFFDR